MLKISTLAFVTTGCILGMSAWSVPIVKAAIITSSIFVEIDSGSLTGNTYSGDFSYDDSSLTGTGTKVIPLLDFSFNFEGNDYTEADDLNAQARFSDGDFLGIDFSVPPYSAFSFVSGDFNQNEAFFTYDLGFVRAGTGLVTYSGQSNSIPEPSTTFGLLSLFSLGLIAKVSQYKDS